MATGSISESKFHALSRSVTGDAMDHGPIASTKLDLLSIDWGIDED